MLCIILPTFLKIMGIGRFKQGLYYLVPHSKSHHFHISKTLCSNFFSSCNNDHVVQIFTNHQDKSSLWHQRFGHISMSRLQLVPYIGEIMSFVMISVILHVLLLNKPGCSFLLVILPLHQYLN